jgi:hypothetical protein
VTAPLPLPSLAAVLLRPRRDALAAFAALGWRPWAHPISLDAERRRTLNVDLTEPDLSLERGGDVAAVAHVEADREGLVTLLEVVGAEPGAPSQLARSLLGGPPGEPRIGGGVAAREWVWGPESGLLAGVSGEPVRLWFCAEKAYGDRLWLVATVVRRPGDDAQDE